MNDYQLRNLRSFLGSSARPDSGTHGVCVGADQQFHEELRSRGIPLIGRPCTLVNQRAKIPDDEFQLLYDPEDPLKRNRKIVRECDYMIIAPHGPEVLRSGTWMSYRFAQAIQKPVIFLWWKNRA